MLLMVAPLEYPMSVSSHLCLGLPLLLAPFILPSIPSFSIPPALTMFQSSLMQPLASLTPVSIPVWCSRWSICLSFSPSTILSVLFSNTTTRKRRSSFSHVFSLSKSPLRIEQSGDTKPFTSFTFVSSITPLSFHIDVSPPIAAFPIAILLRTSFSHSPSLVISAPNKTNFVTTSISFPSTVTSPMSPVVITFVFPTFRYSPAFSLARLTLSQVLSSLTWSQRAVLYRLRISGSSPSSLLCWFHYPILPKPLWLCFLRRYWIVVVRGYIPVALLSHCWCCLSLKAYGKWTQIDRDFLSSAAIMDCQSLTHSSRTNHVTKCRGDIPGQVIGINSILSSPYVMLLTMFSTHAATTVRIVTLITRWYAPGLECNLNGFFIQSRKAIYRINISNTTYPEKFIESIRSALSGIETESAEENWNIRQKTTKEHWLVRGKHHSIGTCHWYQALCSHKLQNRSKSKEQDCAKSCKEQSPTNCSPLCKQLLVTTLPEHPYIVWYRRYQGHVRWN